MAEKPKIGVIAKARYYMGLPVRREGRTDITPKKQKTMGGYADPKPRKKAMDEAGDISPKKKKKGN